MDENNKIIEQYKKKHTDVTLSRELHYEKFIKKMNRELVNLDRNVLVYVLVNNLIDENGIWLEFGESKNNNTNHISHYSKNKLFCFKDVTSNKQIENVEVIEGNFLETIPSFKNNHLSSKNTHVSFLCINCNSRDLSLQIFFNLYKNISNGCIIIFDRLINFQNYEKSSLEALYEFFHIYKIKYEWLGMNGFVNANNEAVGLRILHNPFYKKTNEKAPRNKPRTISYELFDWEKYISEYEDLHELQSKDEAWKHWLNHGCNEKRKFFKTIKDEKEELFDWEKYVSEYEDLNELQSKDEAWDHWLNHGKKECRKFFKIDRTKV